MIKQDGTLCCDRCKKPIMKDTAYALVGASIIMFDPNVKKPPIFTCLEQAYNYGQQLVLHSTCWINALIDHGIKLYDLTEVAKKHKELKKRRKEKTFVQNFNWFKKFFKRLKEAKKNGLEQNNTRQ